MGRSEELVGLQSIKRDLDSFIDGVTRDDTEISVGIKRRDDLFNVIWTKNNDIEIKKNLKMKSGKMLRANQRKDSI
ncbi:hypothetical protein CRU79_01370 [Escherichia sp. E4385]|nr:hypothetical protein CRU79_01370 [Escherichia sp. E4385]